MRVNLQGIGRGQTVVDRRPMAQDQAALDRDPWRVLEVALDLDVDAAAAAFCAVVDAYESGSDDPRRASSSLVRVVVPLVVVGPRAAP